MTISNWRSATAANEKRMEPSLVTTTPFVSKGDDRIDEYRMLGLDSHAIWAWTNHSEPICRRNRGQLLDSFPILVPIFSHHRLNHQTWVKEVEVAVDQGDPLFETLARITRVRGPTVKYLANQRPSEVGFDWIRSVMALFSAINIMPESEWPSSAKEWAQMRTFWILAGLGGLPGDVIFSATCGIRWYVKKYVFTQLCRNGYSKRAEERLNRMTDGKLSGISHVGDYCEYVSNWCSHICWRTEEKIGVPPIYERFLMRYSLAELIRQSLKWHDEIVRIGQQYERSHEPREESELTSWPSLLTEPIKSGDLNAVALTCTDDLAGEGARLRHCVVSYADKCMTGESHIVSIRNAAGASLSTAEIVLESDEQGGWQACVRQHYGMKNATPPVPCERSLVLVLLAVNSPESQAWLRELHLIHERRRTKILDYLAKAQQNLHSLGELVLKLVLPDYDDAVSWLYRESFLAEHASSARRDELWELAGMLEHQENLARHRT